MRVLHIVRRFQPLVGGTERYVGDLARAQAAAGHKVTVATLDRDVTRVVPGRLPARELLDGVIVVRLPGLGTRRMALTTRPDRLVALVRDADVVHLHDLRFQLGLSAMTALLSGKRSFLHTHGLVFHTSAWRRLKRLMFRTYYGPILRSTRTTVLASSESDLRRLEEVVPTVGRNAIVLRNGVDLRPFLGLRPEPEPGRIVAIGRVTPSKGLDRLVRTLAHIKDRPWRLHVHGAIEAAESERLDRLASSLGIRDRVTIHGAYKRDAEPELLRAAALAAFPSRAEGFGIALLDAMAAGTLVLASDIPAHRLLLDGDPNHLVDWDQAADVAVHVADLLDLDPAGSESIRSRLRGLAQAYSVEHVVQSLDRLYCRSI